MKSCKPQTQIERARDAAQAKRKGKRACPDCKGSGTRFEMHLNQCGSFPCPKCKGKLPDIETLVCCDIVLRQQKGMHKYGTTVANNPLSQREWLTHLYHELLDAAIYAKRQLVEPIKGTENEIKNKGKNLPCHHRSSDGNGSMDYL